MALRFFKDNDNSLLSYPAGTYSRGRVEIDYVFDSNYQIRMTLKPDSFTKSDLLNISEFLLAAHGELLK